MSPKPSKKSLKPSSKQTPTPSASATSNPDATGPELIDEFVALDLTIDTYLDRHPDLMTRIDYEQFVKTERARRALWIAKGDKA